MVYCKHWNNGKCKNCKKGCAKKKKLNKLFTKKQKNNTQYTKKQPLQSVTAPAITPPTIMAESLAHGKTVAAIADKLFTALMPLHKCKGAWKDILNKAAMLHDIGWIEGKKEHHKVSAKMIRMRNDVPAKIRPLVALVARYHRRAEPSIKHARFAALSHSARYGVRRMAALLRLADALDFSHTASVQDVTILTEKTLVRLLITCSKDCNAEIARINNKKELFVQFYKKDVQCQCKNEIII